MRTILVVAIIALFALSAQALSHKKAAKLRGVGNTGDYVKDTNLNANVDPNLIANVGLNGLGDIEKESEKSDSFSNHFSKENHHDSQKVDISIHFNIGGDSSSSDEDDELCYETVTSVIKGVTTTPVIGSKDVNIVKELDVVPLVNDLTKNLGGNVVNSAPIVKEINVAPTSNTGSNGLTQAQVDQLISEALKGLNLPSNAITEVQIVPAK